MFDWETLKISEVCRTSSGGTPSRNNPVYYENGEILWVKTGELKRKYIVDTEEKITELALKESSAKLFPENTILMAMYGATIGRVSILKKEASTNQACCALIPDQSKLNTEFLFYTLSFMKKDVISKGSGAAQPNISQQIVRELQINVPSIGEQQKIAEILSSVDEAIEKTEAIIKQTETVKKGLMQQLLTKGIGHTEFKDTEIGSVPASWAVESLKELGTWSGGGTPSKQKEEYWSTMPGIIWVSPKDMYSELITNSEDYISAVAVESKGLKLLPKDTILFVTRSGILRKRVPIAIAGNDLTINQDLKAIQVDNKMEPWYVYYALQSCNEQIRYACVKTGTTVESIDFISLKNFKIPVPPKEEQKKIVELIGKIGEKIDNEKQSLKYKTDLKKGLMQSLLTGKVRVNLDKSEVLV